MAALINAALSGCPVIIGGGVSGLVAALAMQRPCIVVAAGSMAVTSSSYLAQGGVAAAVGAGDTHTQHVADTIAAGGGLCDPLAVQSILSETPQAIETLIRWGVPFARDAGGKFDLHKEAAHDVARILHAHGDGTGRAIMEALSTAVSVRPEIHRLEGISLKETVVEDQQVTGVWLSDGTYLETSQCVLASGGAAGLYPVTTNPAAHTGQPIALALRAGATIMDIEFMQFHPTGFAHDRQNGRCLLISEAVRGAGARLVDRDGREFTDPLLPRDIVARAVAAQVRSGAGAFLDARGLFSEGFARHFPAIAAGCSEFGIDPDHALIPVAPAAHYMMGGVKTDLVGRTTLPGLWACGEVAATGLHGANRLASNSLLEAVVMGLRVGRELGAMSIAAAAGRSPTPSTRSFTTRDYRATMGDALGLMRDGPSLEAALSVFTQEMAQDHHALLGGAMALAALRRCESRGSHWRVDATGMHGPAHSLMTLRNKLTLDFI